jgi:hypothetical protein
MQHKYVIVVDDATPDSQQKSNKRKSERILSYSPVKTKSQKITKTKIKTSTKAKVTNCEHLSEIEYLLKKWFEETSYFENIFQFCDYDPGTLSRYPICDISDEKLIRRIKFRIRFINGDFFGLDFAAHKFLLGCFLTEVRKRIKLSKFNYQNCKSFADIIKIINPLLDVKSMIQKSMKLYKYLGKYVRFFYLIDIKDLLYYAKPVSKYLQEQEKIHKDCFPHRCDYFDDVKKIMTDDVDQDSPIEYRCPKTWSNHPSDDDDY